MSLESVVDLLDGLENGIADQVIGNDDGALACQTAYRVIMG